VIFSPVITKPFQQAFGAPDQFQSNQTGVFVQDEWRWRPDLTINADLRYDLQFLPIRSEQAQTRAAGATAYAPGDRKTVIRSSLIYFDRIREHFSLCSDGTKYVGAVAPIQAAPVFPICWP
jgi:outer membrane receptor protein involved in Fe transport